MKSVQYRNFMRYWRIFFALSLFITMLGVVALIYNVFRIGSPLNLGVDFTGGNVLELEYAGKVTTGEISDLVRPFSVKEPTVQTSSTSEGKTLIFIRTPVLSDQNREKLEQALSSKYPNIVLQKVDSVGPAFGRELAVKGSIAVLISWFIMLIYIFWRFRFSFAVGAIVALIHDVIVVLGIFALFHLEVNTPFIGAILTIIGYSINDTIIVFDRIRENLKLHRASSLYDTVNMSILQVLIRSINTTLTTLITVLAILFFGGPTLHSFALALAIGFFSGTYSSWFIASPIMMMLEVGGVKKPEEFPGRPAPVHRPAPVSPAPRATSTPSSVSLSPSSPSPPRPSSSFPTTRDSRKKKKKARRR